MKTYKVTITETLKMGVEVQAESQWEAERIASDNWRNSQYILDAECFDEVEFEAEEVKRTKENCHGYER